MRRSCAQTWPLGIATPVLSAWPSLSVLIELHCNQCPLYRTTNSTTESPEWADSTNVQGSGQGLGWARSGLAAVQSRAVKSRLMNVCFHHNSRPGSHTQRIHTSRPHLPF